MYVADSLMHIDSLTGTFAPVSDASRKRSKMNSCLIALHLFHGQTLLKLLQHINAIGGESSTYFCSDLRHILV